jgi:hypothetical protein
VGLIAVALLFDFLNGLHNRHHRVHASAEADLRGVLGCCVQFHRVPVLGPHVAEALGTGIVAAGAIDARVFSARCQVRSSGMSSPD